MDVMPYQKDVEIVRNERLTWGQVIPTLLLLAFITAILAALLFVLRDATHCYSTSWSACHSELPAPGSYQLNKEK